MQQPPPAPSGPPLLLLWMNHIDVGVRQMCVWLCVWEIKQRASTLTWSLRLVFSWSCREKHNTVSNMMMVCVCVFCLNSVCESDLPMQHRGEWRGPAQSSWWWSADSSAWREKTANKYTERTQPWAPLNTEKHSRSLTCQENVRWCSSGVSWVMYWRWEDPCSLYTHTWTTSHVHVGA